MERRQPPQAGAMSQPGPGAVLRWAATEPGWYTGTLVPWLATAGSPDDRPPVRALLPDVLAERGSRPRALEFLLDRWQGMQGDAAANGLAARLRSAMSWHASAGMLVLPSAFLLFLLFVVLVASLGNAG